MNGFLIFIKEYASLHRNTSAIVLCYFHDISRQQLVGARSTIHQIKDIHPKEINYEQRNEPLCEATERIAHP